MCPSTSDEPHGVPTRRDYGGAETAGSKAARQQGSDRTRLGRKLALAAAVVVAIIGGVMSAPSVESSNLSLPGVLYALLSGFHTWTALALLVGGGMLLMFRQFPAAGVLIVVGVSLWLAPELRPRPHSPAPASEARLRLMSLNVYVSNQDIDAIERAVREVDPDVLLLQEYATSVDEQLAPRLLESWPYHFRRPVSGAYGGLAIFSKTPLLDPRWVPFDSFKPVLVARVTLDSRELLLVNVHLRAPWNIDSIRANWREITQLLALVDQHGLDAIVAGDFNFSDLAPQASRMRAGGWTSAHEQAGRRFSSTFPRAGWKRVFPGLRLDQCWLAGRLVATLCLIGPDAGSDHRPLVVEVAFTHPNGAHP